VDGIGSYHLMCSSYVYVMYNWTTIGLAKLAKREQKNPLIGTVVSKLVQ